MRSLTLSPALTLMLFVVSLGYQAPRAESHEPRAVVDNASYLEQIIADLEKSYPHNRRIVIACHGHSVPTGYFATPKVRPFDSYPHLLHVQLQSRYPNAVIEVICTGRGGENSEEGAARFADDVLAKGPDLLTIDYALNDRAIGLDRANRAWTYMIQAAQESNVKVLLLTPTPDLHAKLGDPTDALEEHAAQVLQLSRRHKVGLVDSFSAFKKCVAKGRTLKSLMVTRNHPNRAGHELVAEELVRWFATSVPVNRE